jgi:hypothetical protein
MFINSFWVFGDAAGAKTGRDCGCPGYLSQVTDGLDPRREKAPDLLPVSVARFSHWDASEPGKVLVRAPRGRQCRLWFSFFYRLRVEAVVRHRVEQGYHQPPRGMCVTRLPSLFSLRSNTLPYRSLVSDG